MPSSALPTASKSTAAQRRGRKRSPAIERCARRTVQCDGAVPAVYTLTAAPPVRVSLEVLIAPHNGEPSEGLGCEVRPSQGRCFACFALNNARTRSTAVAVAAIVVCPVMSQTAASPWCVCEILSYNVRTRQTDVVVQTHQRVSRPVLLHTERLARLTMPRLENSIHTRKKIWLRRRRDCTVAQGTQESRKLKLEEKYQRPNPTRPQSTTVSSRTTMMTTTDPPPALPSSSPPPRRVPISIADGRAYVWSASDVLYLRAQHRIIGILTGSLPLLPQQNAYLGLPLQLMPEEVLLLVDRDAAILVDDQQAHSAPTRAQWEQFEQDAEMDMRQQREALWRGNVEQKARFEEALKKKKARRGGDGDNDDGAQAKALASSTPPEDLSSYTYSHVTLDSSDSLPWYALPTDPAQPHLVAQLTSSTTTTRRTIFNHLNAQGYYLSCGLRFGGDFVVYPGDPFRYHSHYTLTCPEDSHKSFSVGKLIADGRLGTAVKKVHLIASRDCGQNQADDEELITDAAVNAPSSSSPLSYYSLTWAGFGT